jgi:hypothetical protein
MVRLHFDTQEEETAFGIKIETFLSPIVALRKAASTLNTPIRYCCSFVE